MESGKIWPIHLKPLDDELLSSWIIRLAHAHGLKVMTLCTLLFGYRRPVWNRDIDRLAPKDILDKLSQITGTPPERVYATTLRELEGKAFEKFNLTGNTHWVLPLGIRSRSHKDYGLQYCRQCLLEDPLPYFRRSWRLGFITVCTKHKTVLSDCCGSCGASVMPHRVDMRSRTDYPSERDMLVCANCGSSLLGESKGALADDVVVREQQQWEEAMSKGWITWAGNPSMYSQLFFEGLRMICSGLTARKERNRLGRHLKGLRKVTASVPIRGVEYARADTRHELMRVVVALLDAWPERFLQVMRDSSFRYSTLHGYMENAPYWYDSLIRRELKRTNTSMSHMDSEAIIHAVESTYGVFTLELAKKVTGIDVSKQFHSYVSPDVTDEIYDEFIAGIDHRISGTQDKATRLALLRDKVMFSTARVLGLTAKKLSMLTIPDVAKMASKCVAPRFYQAPRTPEQARAWCEWYIEKVRPLLLPGKGVDRVFVSLRTHSGMSSSLIGARFQSAVKLMQLHRNIKDFSCFTRLPETS